MNEAEYKSEAEKQKAKPCYQEPYEQPIKETNA
jgi:hypothetical protein